MSSTDPRLYMIKIQNMINTNISKHIINIKTLTIYLEVCQQNQGSADNEIQTKRFNTSNVHING